MARFISINEILHRGRFAEKKEQDSNSPSVTDAPIKEEMEPVNVTETPEDVEPTIQDTPEEANVIEADPVIEATTVVEEEVAPKKKGGKKTKVTEENN